MVEDLPSQMSVDEWGEVVKYSKVLDTEMRSKEKSDFLNKQRLVKQTLDQQVSEQLKQKEKLNNERNLFDQMIIENDKRDMAREGQKRDLQKQKVLEAKRMRDQMISEAQNKRKEHERQVKNQEQSQAHKLQLDIQNEKSNLKKKKDLEREQARLVI